MLRIGQIFILLGLSLASAMTSAQNAPPIRPIATVARHTMMVPGYADFLALDGQEAWVTNAGRVDRLRPGQNTPVATVPVAEPCGGMAVAFGALWVVNCRTRALVRIDLSTNAVVAEIPTGVADPSGEVSVAAGAGSVWLLTDAAGILSRIDPTSNSVVAQIPVQPHSYAAAFGFGSVWISTTGTDSHAGEGSVQRIDPASNRVVATIPVGPAPRFLAAGEGGVWTLNQGDGSVSRIDPALNTQVATIATAAPGSGGDIATGGGRVWVRATKLLLQAIDPRTNQVVARFGPTAGSGAVRANDSHVWVTAHDIQMVWVLPSR